MSIFMAGTSQDGLPFRTHLSDFASPEAARKYAAEKRKELTPATSLEIEDGGEVVERIPGTLQ